MLEIYFDGVLLDPINYMELTQKWVMFDKEFKLGMTPSREFRLTIPKSVFNPNTQEVKIRYNNQDYAYLIIDKYNVEENLVMPKVKLVLCDKMVLFNEEYDASPICPTTCKGILEDICNKFGVELGTTTFLNEDESVNFWDSNTTAREYISYISEIAGGFARIENDGKLYIRYFENVNTHQLNEELCEQILIGQPHEIRRVVFDNGVLKFVDYTRNNLVRFSDTFKAGNTASGITSSLTEKGELKVITQSSNGNWHTGWWDINNNFTTDVENQFEEGDTFTIVFTIKKLSGSTGKPSIYIKNGMGYYTMQGTVGEEYSELYCTGTWKKTNPISLHLGWTSTTGTFIIKNFMIKKGGYSRYEPYDLTNYNGVETLYLNPSNVYINTEEQFDSIVSKILGFKYWNLTTGNAYILSDAMCGDVLYLPYNGSNYYTIQNIPELKFLGLWNGGYELNLESGVQQETKQKSLNTQVKAIKIKQNRDENILSIAVEDIKTQKEVTNTEIFNQITANNTLIQQTATEITQNVTEIAGNLQGNIDVVANDLTDATNNLTGLIQQNTTLIQQLATSIISTIKATGGNNLLRNSVGYSGTDFWSKTGNITTNQDDNMSLSGSEFILTGASTLSQQYNTRPGTSYSVSCKIKHRSVGTPNQVKIEIVGQGSTMITILDTTEVNNEWKEISLSEPYVASITNPTIKITCTGDDILEITDLIVALGENNVWSGFGDEVYGKEHKLDRNGLRLSNLAGNNSSKTTSNSIQMLEGEDVVAELSKKVVKSDSAVITNSFSIGRLQTVVLDNNNIIEYV